MKYYDSWDYHRHTMERNLKITTEPGFEVTAGVLVGTQNSPSSNYQTKEGKAQLFRQLPTDKDEAGLYDYEMTLFHWRLCLGAERAFRMARITDSDPLSS